MTEMLLQNWRDNSQIFKKSYAQVETLVRPQTVSPKSGELKLKAGKPYRLMGRFSHREREIVKAKAKRAAMAVNEYIRATALGSDYKPKADPGLQNALRMLNRELTAQGRNLNQIAKHLNSGTSPNEGVAMLETVRMPLIHALRAVKHALANNAPMP